MSYMMYEGYILSDKDILYNKDKFESGDINICFITGLSGSGKSTMANTFNKKAEVYQLDDVVVQWKFTDENLKEYGDLIYSFFKGPGKKWRGTSEEIDKQWAGTDDEYEKTLTQAFIKYALNYAKSHKNTKFIVEGVWLFYFINPSDLKDCTVYIKGTSAIKSRHRSALRDSSDAKSKTEKIKSYIKIMTSRNNKYYFANEKLLQKWRDYFSKLQNEKEETMNTKYYQEVKFAKEAEDILLEDTERLLAIAEAKEIGLISLNEGLKETLQLYIQKIKDGLDKAFNKLKDIIENKQNNILVNLKDQIEQSEDDPKFTIDAFSRYDTRKLTTPQYQIKPLDYEAMKDQLSKSREEFLQSNYPECYDKELSIKDKIMKDITISTEDTKCTNQILLDCIDFCLDGYKNIYNQIEQDKNIIKTSCDAALAIANSIDTTPQPTSQDVNKESAILEADDDNKDKFGFTDDPDAKENKSTPMKVISSWCAITTSIYSGKLKALNTIRSQYYRIILHQARLKGWNIVPNKK